MARHTLASVVAGTERFPGVTVIIRPTPLRFASLRLVLEAGASTSFRQVAIDVEPDVLADPVLLAGLLHGLLARLFPPS